MKHLALWSCLLLAACPTSVQGPEGPHFLWEADVASLDNPFPDARFLTAAGADLRPDWFRPFMMKGAVTGKMRAFFDAYALSAKTEIHGIGNFGPTLLLTSAPVDRASLSGHFHRLRKVGEGYEVLQNDLVTEHVRDLLDAEGLPVPADLPEFTLVQVGTELREGEEGLLVVTAGVKTADGVALVRGRSFEASQPPTAAAAAALGVSEAEVLLTLPLKAAPVSNTLSALATWVDGPDGLAAVTIPAKGIVPGNTAPMVPVGVWTSADPDWSTMMHWLNADAFFRPVVDVGRVVIGSLAARDLRGPDLVWKADWVANPSSAPVVPLRFVLTVPAGTRPAGGWPVVLGAHGLGGRNTPAMGDDSSFCLELGQYLAKGGFACLGIDAPNHGDRGNQFNFFAIENMAEIRDEFREMTFDLLQVSRAVPTIDVDGDGAPDLAAELSFFGHSLGAIMGAHYVAFDPRVKTVVLNVPGGGLSNILVSTDIRDQVGLLLVAKTELTFLTPEYYTSFPLLRAIAQPFLEPGDNINVAHGFPTDRALLQQMGVGDLTIPNFTSLDLAHSLKLPEPTADVIGTVPVHGFFRADPKVLLTGAEANINGHEVFWHIKLLRDQALRFLKTRGTELQVVP